MNLVTLTKAWRQAHGEERLGNLHASETAVRVALDLELKLGLEVSCVEARTDDWVAPLWRRIGGKLGVLVLVGPEGAISLWGKPHLLSHVEQLGSTMEEKIAAHVDRYGTEEVAWNAISATSPFTAAEREYCSELLSWARARIDQPIPQDRL